jgi:hypothetical protein
MDPESTVAQAEAQLKSLKKYPRLEDWKILFLEGDPRFVDDPKVDLKLEGKIYDSPYPQFSDGGIIQTLPLIAFNIGMRRAATTQAVYDLGEVDPAFLKYVKELGKQLSDYNLNEKNLRAKPKPGV